MRFYFIEKKFSENISFFLAFFQKFGGSL